MLRLNMTVQINPSFSWLDWELYDMPGAVGAAAKLNKTLKNAVNQGCRRPVLENTMDLTMSELCKFGASDTEARNFLYRVLNEIFGE